jgi:hypothetical protein
MQSLPRFYEFSKDIIMENPIYPPCTYESAENCPVFREKYDIFYLKSQTIGPEGRIEKHQMLLKICRYCRALSGGTEIKTQVIDPRNN